MVNIKIGLGLPTANSFDDPELLRKINKFEEILETYVGTITVEKILEVGCGNGLFIMKVAERSKLSIGIDIQLHFLKEARRILKNVSIKKRDIPSFILASGEAMPFQSEYFDACLCFETLEHVIDDEEVLREIHRVLKGSGSLFLTLPNGFFPMEQHSIIFGERVIEKPIPFLPWFPSFLREKFARARNYTAKTIMKMLYKNGFSPRCIDFLFPTWKTIKSKRIRAWLIKVQSLFKYVRPLLGKIIFIFAEKSS